MNATPWIWIIGGPSGVSLESWPNREVGRQVGCSGDLFQPPYRHDRPGPALDAGAGGELDLWVGALGEELKKILSINLFLR